MLITATHINTSIFKNLVIGISLFATVQLHAQSNNFFAAEKLYNKGDFYSALTYYSAFLANEKANKTINKFTGYLSKHTGKNQVTTNTKLVATIHLATAYRLLSDYNNAAIWYDSVKQIKGWEVYPEVDYWLGVSSRASGHIAKAKTTLTSYLSLPVDKCLYVKEAKKELADMDFAANELSLKKRRKSVITKLPPPVNGDASNYAGVFVSGNLVFSSTRSDSNQINDKANLYQHHLYTTANGSVSKLNFSETANIEQGAASFSADGKLAFFTQWETINGRQIGAIYTSQFKDTIWSKPIKLDTLVNRQGYTSQQPFVSSDGKYLFFASDRVGGKGKFDIWCAELEKSFVIKKVVNLPTSVNTADNEKSPYFNTTTQTLVFASDGLIGMGGYDVFASKQVNNVFGKATNLGSPINSNKDDMYFFSKENTTNIIDDVLLSSDRDSKCCLELFTIRRLPSPINTIIGTVRNSTTQEAINNIAFNWLTNGKLAKVNVNNMGIYNLTVTDTINYTVTLSSANYADTSVVVSHIFRTPEDSVLYQDFYLRPLPPIVAAFDKDYTLYFDFDKASLNDSSILVLKSLANLLSLHTNWKLRIDGFTDAKGADAYNLKLSKKRTESCFLYLKTLIINSKSIITSFFGEAMPIAPNTLESGVDNPGGRQLNRRVSLSVVIP